MWATFRSWRAGAAGGGGGRDYSTEVFPTGRDARGPDTLSVVNPSVLRRYRVAILVEWPARSRSMRLSSVRTRWPKASVRTSRTTDAARGVMVSAFGCGPAPVARSCLRDAARAERDSRSDVLPVRSKDVQRVLDRGRKVHGTRVVVFLAPGTGQVAVVASRRVGGAVE